jgi:hypothetical protein
MGPIGLGTNITVLARSQKIFRADQSSNLLLAFSPAQPILASDPDETNNHFFSKSSYVGFEVSTAVTKNNAVFWDMPSWV